MKNAVADHLGRIPGWANWKATDYSGEVWLYESEPYFSFATMTWESARRTHIYSISQGNVENWHKTKDRIND